jgi:TonB family protein
LSVKQATETYQATSLEQKEITLDGYSGLFVRLQLPDRSNMRLKLYAVDLRIYQLMIKTPPEQGATQDRRRFYDAAADKFLNSFKLAPVPPAVITGGRAEGVSGPLPQNPPGVPVSGTVLNGKIISKPEPRYPEAARKAGVLGTVVVALTIDEEGKVIAARALAGPAELREAAVEAALKARFTPTLLSGTPVKVSGRLTYNFWLR